MKEAIRLEGVTAGYRRGNPVIHDIDLTVPENDFLAIIGPNGGGKTTLLKVILGLLAPWEGSVSVLGASPEKTRPAIGYVPQLIPDDSFPITVIDVVLMGRLRNAGLFRRYSRNDRKTAEMNLARLNVGDLAGDNMNSLSGGQKQRVLIARALAGKPQILLLDEPVASVDHDTQKSFFNLLAELNSDMTIVLVTHDVGAVSAHVKTIACINRTLMSHGETLSSESVAMAYGCPFELISHGGIPHRVLGNAKESES